MSGISSTYVVYVHQRVRGVALVVAKQPLSH